MMPITAAVNMDNLIKSFQIMGKGMLGIFVVLILIALIVMLLTYLTSGSANKEKDDQ